MDPAQRRREILEAARAVFTTRGYGGASMRLIAAAAGVNEALLYRISPSKEQLFAQAVAEPLEDAVNRTTDLSLVPPTASDSQADVRERSTLFIRDLLAAMREIAPMLNAVLLADRDIGEAFYRDRVEPAMAAIRAVIESNLALWEHRSFDSEVIVRAVYGMCWFFAIDDRYGTGLDKQPDQLAPELLSLLLDGLVTRAARE
jgi:AcrR family transcriptional regulator